MLDPKRVEEDIRPITTMLLDLRLEVKKEWIRELLMDLDAMMTWADQPGYESILQDVKETIERRFIRRSW
jgi:hypothetical protein